MNRNFSSLLFVFFLFLAVPFSFSAENEDLNSRLESYMKAYRAYLKAQVENDPSIFEKLQKYNEAYDDYVGKLKESPHSGEKSLVVKTEVATASEIASRTISLHPESLSSSSEVSSASQNFDRIASTTTEASDSEGILKGN